MTCAWSTILREKHTNIMSKHARDEEEFETVTFIKGAVKVLKKNGAFVRVLGPIIRRDLERDGNFVYFVQCCCSAYTEIYNQETGVSDFCFALNNEKCFSVKQILTVFFDILRDASPYISPTLRWFTRRHMEVFTQEHLLHEGILPTTQGYAKHADGFVTSKDNALKLHDMILNVAHATPIVKESVIESTNILGTQNTWLDEVVWTKLCENTPEVFNWDLQEKKFLAEVCAALVAQLYKNRRRGIVTDAPRMKLAVACTDFISRLSIGIQFPQGFKMDDVDFKFKQ